MQELLVEFTPADGGPPRPITLRIGTPVKGPRSWSALVEILGFEKPHAARSQGEDWAQVIELSAMVLPHALELMVKAAGGGTIEPPFYKREAKDPSATPPESPSEAAELAPR